MKKLALEPLPIPAGHPTFLNPKAVLPEAKLNPNPTSWTRNGKPTIPSEAELHHGITLNPSDPPQIRVFEHSLYNFIEPPLFQSTSGAPARICARPNMANSVIALLKQYQQVVIHAKHGMGKSTLSSEVANILLRKPGVHVCALDVDLRGCFGASDPSCAYTSPVRRIVHTHLPRELQRSLQLDNPPATIAEWNDYLARRNRRALVVLDEGCPRTRTDGDALPSVFAGLTQIDALFVTQVEWAYRASFQHAFPDAPRLVLPPLAAESGIALWRYSFPRAHRPSRDEATAALYYSGGNIREMAAMREALHGRNDRVHPEKVANAVYVALRSGLTTFPDRQYRFFRRLLNQGGRIPLTTVEPADYLGLYYSGFVGRSGSDLALRIGGAEFLLQPEWNNIEQTRTEYAGDPLWADFTPPEEAV